MKHSVSLDKDGEVTVWTFDGKALRRIWHVRGGSRSTVTAVRRIFDDVGIPVDFYPGKGA